MFRPGAPLSNTLLKLNSHFRSAIINLGSTKASGCRVQNGLQTGRKMDLKNLSARQKNLLLITCCGIGILGIVGFLIWLNRLNAKLAESQSWPSTTGSIVSTTIKESSWTSGSGYAETTETVYIPALKYVYSLGGREYTSENITADTSWGLGSFNTEEEALDYLIEY